MKSSTSNVTFTFIKYDLFSLYHKVAVFMKGRIDDQMSCIFIKVATFMKVVDSINLLVKFKM